MLSLFFVFGCGGGGDKGEEYLIWFDFQLQKTNYFAPFKKEPTF